MHFYLEPGGKLVGSIRVPGDKSMSHRVIMLGAIAEGKTDVSGFLEGEDALSTLGAFRNMGVMISEPESGRLSIEGVGLRGLQAPTGIMDVGNSGTSIRLMAGLLAGQTFSSVLTGDQSLLRRPMARVITPLSQMGAVISSREGCPPLEISGGRKLRGVHYELPVASAQVKSSVLLAGLFAEGFTSVVEPAPTRDHTERMLTGFGYAVEVESGSIGLEGGGTLQGTRVDIPADISSAAFFMVGASIAEGSDLVLEHVGINPTRDGVIRILKAMGADIESSNERDVGGEPVADLRIRSAPLRGIDIPVEEVPLAIDELPAILIAAACAEGVTVLRGAEELRVKESDRIASMAEGLTQLGISNTVHADGITVIGGDIGGGVIATHHDHRIAMSFAMAALRASDRIKVSDCAHVATSFPGFAELAARVGLRLDVADT
ncbi:3-phosphoshikimate 1-carboxyvinyltransferase [Luminiphilus sp.]|jgi:3-phosphoshikimate 1-carboxyvinyltransferase|nr:3-phosphoshikimate 1-carboxyvinyltransferase [Luminiphilus sp.]MDA8619765.1 3-phosphoshikimate 1-carboxyvinyltransferase [Luminiphilus sp.]MDB2688483.1 3-phosphoshikimate 1-carboxyvinyltransferase [Luminiphilus sp.]